MIDVAKVEGLEAIEQLALFVFAFVDDDQYVAELSERMGKADVILLPDEEVNALCQRLCAAGFLRCDQYVWDRPRYKLCDRFSPVGLARLLEISVERTWWRIFGYDDETPRPTTLSVSEFGKDLRATCRWDCAAMAFMMRQLISGKPMAVKYGGAYDEDSIQWLVVDDFLSSVDMTPGEPFRPKLSKRSPVGLYFKLLSGMLTRGLDVSPLLKLLGDAAREAQIDFSGGEYCEFVSLCILTGHVDWIDGAAPGDDVSFDEFAELAPLLEQGDLAAANDICAEVGKSEELSRLDRPGCNLLSLLVGAFARPSPTRAAKCIRALAPNANYRAYDRSEGERREVETRSGIFHSLSLGVTGSKSHYNLTGKQFDFLRNLGESVWGFSTA